MVAGTNNPAGPTKSCQKWQLFVVIKSLLANAKKTTFESGKTVIEFSNAKNYTYRSNGEKVTDTTWHDCKLWRNGESVQIADYLKKGTLISVSGYLRYQNVKGSKQKRTFIQVQDVKLLAIVTSN
jgi:single-stranded DNA-binding protein